MSYKLHTVRPGLTAIAAVLALSSTPLLAQDVVPATVTVAPPPVVTPPAVTTAVPATATLATPAETVAPAAPSAGLVTVPIRPGGIAPELNAAPIAPAAVSAPQIETESRPAARTARATPAPTPRDSAPAAPIAVERAAPVAPPVAAAEPAPAPAPAAPVAQAPAAAPTAVTATRTGPADASDDMLPIVGAAGAAVLLIGGSVFALRRRRREDELPVDAPDAIVAPVAPAPQPAAYAAPRAAATVAPTAHARMPLASNAPATTLPAGFDLSRFGRHTQAAYQGPTSDNPFLSLRSRLKRASFLDQRERMASQGTAPAAQVAATPVARPVVAPRQTEHITTRIKSPPRPGFRPAWQS